MLLEGKEGKQMFDEGLTPQLLPTPKFNWEIQEEKKRKRSLGWLMWCSEFLMEVANHRFLRGPMIYPSRLPAKE